MRNATELLLNRSRDGLSAALADLDISSAQFSAAAGLEPLPEAVLDLPSDLRAVIDTLARCEALLAGLLPRKTFRG